MIDLQTMSNDEIVLMIDSVLRDQLFEKNTDETRQRTINKLSDMLPNDGSIGLLICDKTNNTPEMEERRALRVDFYFKRTPEQTLHIPRIVDSTGCHSPAVTTRWL